MLLFYIIHCIENKSTANTASAHDMADRFSNNTLVSINKVTLCWATLANGRGQVNYFRVQPTTKV